MSGLATLDGTHCLAVSDETTGRRGAQLCEWSSATSTLTVGAWVNVPAGLKEGAIVARMDDRKGLQGWELFVQNGKFGVQIATAEPAAQLRALSKNATARTGVWQHVLATYDGSHLATGFRLFVDGNPQLVVPSGAPLWKRCQSL